MPECAYERSSAPRARGVMLPLAACLSNGTSGFFLGAGGGSRTHFSHPFLGNLGVEGLEIYHQILLRQHVSHAFTAQHDGVVLMDCFEGRTTAYCARISLRNFGK